MRRLRRHLPTVLIAMVTAVVVMTAPAIGHGVHAMFAHNADKVDGKHAVGAGASRSQAAGKLVATKGKGPAKGRFATKFLPKGLGLGVLGGSWSTVSSSGGVALSAVGSGVGSEASFIVAPVDLRVRRFTVRLTLTQTAGTRSFSVQLAGSPNLPLCSIPTGGNSCTSTTPVALEAGDRFRFWVSASGASPTTEAHFGWLATS